jgi:hypothetical protein
LAINVTFQRSYSDLWQFSHDADPMYEFAWTGGGGAGLEQPPSVRTNPTHANAVCHLPRVFTS